MRYILSILTGLFLALPATAQTAERSTIAETTVPISAPDPTSQTQAALGGTDLATGPTKLRAERPAKRPARRAPRGRLSRATDHLSIETTDAKTISDFSGAGQLTVMTSDTPRGDVNRYAIIDGTDITPVTATKRMPSLINHRARMHDGSIVSASDRPTAVPASVRVLGIMVAYADKPARPITAAQLDDAIDGPGNAAEFYATQSGGTTALSTDVVPRYVVSSQTFDGNCESARVTDDALAGARAQGYDTDQYDRFVIYVADTGTCNQAAAGYAGGPYVWLNTSIKKRILVHELGHTFGLGHANTIDCYDGSSRVTFSSGCSENEYGDPFDSMGASDNSLPLFSTWHRWRIGQLVGSAVKVTSSRTVTVDGSAGPGQTLALVPRKRAGQPITSWWALELREPQAPFDTFPNGSPATTGVSVRLVGAISSFNATGLIDATPQTHTFADAAFQPGRGFTDREYGISIDVRSVANGRASVAVEMPAFTDDTGPNRPLLTARRTAYNTVALSWTPSVDDVTESVSYLVLRDGQQIRTASNTAVTVEDDGRSHTYSVVAVDGADNRSAVSEALAQQLADSDPPTPPSGVTARQNGGDVTITWNASIDANAPIRYRVTQNGAVLNITTETSLTYTPTVYGAVTYSVVAIDRYENASAAGSARLNIVDPNAGSDGATPGGDTPGSIPGGTTPGSTPGATTPGATTPGGATSGGTTPGGTTPASPTAPSGSNDVALGTTPDSTTTGAQADIVAPVISLASPKFKKNKATLPRNRKLSFRVVDASTSRVRIRIKVGSKTKRVNSQTKKVGSKAKTSSAVVLTAAQARKATVTVTAVDAAGNRSTLTLRVKSGKITKA